MRNFLQNFAYKLSRFMYGRYGYDEFSRFLSLATLVILILTFFRGLWAPLGYLYFLGLALVIYTTFRSLSKNHNARLKERAFYLKASNSVKKFFRKIKGFFKIQIRRFKERKTYKYFTCPKCKTTIRVPRGHGKVAISCPKCKITFVGKT